MVVHTIRIYTRGSMYFYTLLRSQRTSIHKHTAIAQSNARASKRDSRARATCDCGVRDCAHGGYTVSNYNAHNTHKHTHLPLSFVGFICGCNDWYKTHIDTDGGPSFDKQPIVVGSVILDCDWPPFNVYAFSASDASAFIPFAHFHFTMVPIVSFLVVFTAVLRCDREFPLLTKCIYIHAIACDACRTTARSRWLVLG